MKKILGLGVVAMLVMALVGGGTWAYFNDVETSSANILTAGTLNLGLANASGGSSNSSVTGTWALSNMAPGNTTTGTLWARNSGTIDMTSLNITFDYTITNGTPGSGNHVAALEGQTLEALKLLPSGTLLGTGLGNGVEAGLNIVWTLNTAATNGCQGDTANITVTLIGQQ
jgi:predicted ribosomally synthesized peptide with SipW-like signal peptide